MVILQTREGREKSDFERLLLGDYKMRRRFIPSPAEWAQRVAQEAKALFLQNPLPTALRVMRRLSREAYEKYVRARGNRKKEWEKAWLTFRSLANFFWNYLEKLEAQKQVITPPKPRPRRIKTPKAPKRRITKITGIDIINLARKYNVPLDLVDVKALIDPMLSREENIAILEEYFSKLSRNQANILAQQFIEEKYDAIWKEFAQRARQEMKLLEEMKQPEDWEVFSVYP